jgi:hypothetical protein
MGNACAHIRMDNRAVQTNSTHAGGQEGVHTQISGYNTNNNSLLLHDMTVRQNNKADGKREPARPVLVLGEQRQLLRYDFSKHFSSTSAKRTALEACRPMLLCSIWLSILSRRQPSWMLRKRCTSAHNLHENTITRLKFA